MLRIPNGKNLAITDEVSIDHYVAMKHHLKHNISSRPRSVTKRIPDEPDIRPLDTPETTRGTSSNELL